MDEDDEGDDDDDDDKEDEERLQGVVYEVCAVHERATYKTKAGKEGGFQYLIEYVGYPNQEDFSWIFDYELDCDDTIRLFNSLHPLHQGSLTGRVAPVVKDIPDSQLRSEYVEREAHEWQQANPDKDMAAGALTALWDKSWEATKKNKS